MRQLKNILRKHPFSICFSLSQHYFNLKTFHIVSSPCNCLLRCNFSLVARYWLKFTLCTLLVVKSLVTRCKICSLLVKKWLVAKNHSLLVAEVARCKKSLVTRCRSCSLQKITRYSLQNSLVARCRSGVNCCKFMKKKLHHRCFPVNFCETLRTLILWNIYERLLLKMISKHQQTFYSFSLSFD